MADAQNRILILFAHPALERSRVNRVLTEGLDSLPGVTFHDLYEAYPDFDIDVRREQALLETHDVVVLQHPFFWYSTPAILKQWQDLVLAHGWAYGHEGTALSGKKLMNAVSTGAGRNAYTVDGFHQTTVEELLLPIKKTATLCGMEYLSPFVVYGAHGMTPDRLDAYAAEYKSMLERLIAG